MNDFATVSKSACLRRAPAMSTSKWDLPTSWKRMDAAGLVGLSTGRDETPQPKVELPVAATAPPTHLLQPLHRMLAVQCVALLKLEAVEILAVAPS